MPAGFPHAASSVKRASLAPLQGGGRMRRGWTTALVLALATAAAVAGDWKGKDLSRKDLRRENLAGEDLSDANLDYAELSGMDLTKTIFRGASLYGTRFAGSKLAGADFRD